MCQECVRGVQSNRVLQLLGSRWDLGHPRPGQVASVYPICCEHWVETKFGRLKRTIPVYSVHLLLNTSAYMGSFVWNVFIEMTSRKPQVQLKYHLFHDVFPLSPVFSRLSQFFCFTVHGWTTFWDYYLIFSSLCFPHLSPPLKHTTDYALHYKGEVKLGQKRKRV